MSWNSEPQVQSVVGRSLEDVLELRPRRQDLKGFDPCYSDIVDYIVRCTQRIWSEKNVGLIRSHYGKDCLLFSLAGASIGAEAVVADTLSALTGHPDRMPIAEDVIWSEDEPGRVSPFAPYHECVESSWVRPVAGFAHGGCACRGCCDRGLRVQGQQDH